MIESWVCRPPNAVMFQLTRVNFDKENKRLVKNNQKFEFDKTIYMDLFLYQNRDLSSRLSKNLEQMKAELKQLKEVLDRYSSEGIVSQLGSCFNLMSKSTDQLAQMLDEGNKRECSIEGRKVEYFAPDEIYRCLPKVKKEEIETSLKVIHMFKEQA